MTSQKNSDNLIAKPCKALVLYGEGNLKEVFIKDFDASIKHSLHNYWATNPQSDEPYIAFQKEYLLSIQNDSADTRTSNILNTNPTKPYTRRL